MSTTAVESPLAVKVPPKHEHFPSEQQSRAAYTDLLKSYHLMTPDEVDWVCSQEKYASNSGVVAELIARRSVNVLVGDSGIGKSPLAYQLALCVAAGVPFLGMPTQQGPVVYADYENGSDEGRDLRERLCRFLKLPKGPDDFLLWTPDTGDSLNIEGICRDVKPAFFVLDSLRSHNPHFEKAENAGAELKNLNSIARKHGAAFLVIHHIRKPKPAENRASSSDRASSLDSEGTPLMLWLKETAGHSSIINQSHTRIAADAPDGRTSEGKAEAALVLRWHRRIKGEIGPLYLERVCDEDGDPAGYRPLTDVKLLGNTDQEAAFKKLPQQFTFKEAKEKFGRSDDPTRKWLQKCISLGLIRQTARGRYERL
jgi:hypothetical protein